MKVMDYEHKTWKRVHIILKLIENRYNKIVSHLRLQLCKIHTCGVNSQNMRK